ncbi:MAG TPA: hypothetical protein VFT50_07210 [Baekduia sp.]|nr:hypothetical protein [Baekduia sp.]
MTEQAHPGDGGRDEDPDVARAEELVDRVAGQVAAAARLAFERTREEAEDLWAEARDLARR